MGTNAIILDCESTGFLPPIEVIELAYSKPMPFDFEPITANLGVHCVRYKPTKEIENGAMAAHHIISKDLWDCPAWTVPAVDPTVGYFIGHGVDYDWGLVGAPDIKRIDTLALARQIWPDETKHSLGALIYHVHEDKAVARKLVKDAHSAEADVRMCAVLLQRILEVGQLSMDLNSWEDLWKWSEVARIPTRMWLGKHKGLPMAEVPRSYKSWALANMTDPPLNEWQRIALSR